MAGGAAAALLGAAVLTGFAFAAVPEASSLQLGAQSPAAHWSAFEGAGKATGDGGGRSALVHAQQLGLGNRAAAVQLWAGKIAARWSGAAKSSQGADGTLLWPVQGGRHVRGYGSGQNAYHLAVDIAAPQGSDVLAAAPGIVGYVGNQMRGYGNLLILVHDGGRATFYAHNQSIVVVPGERVARGQTVARVGSTGNSEGPHVHFELVHNERNCDPAPLFRTLDNGLALRSAPAATWMADEPKPREVRCARRRKHPPHTRDGAPTLAQAQSMFGQPLAVLTTPRLDSAL